MTDLPEVSAAAADKVMQWLQERENLLRPPAATARFLVFCVKLHELALPFPPRKEAAEHLQCSVALIDMALSQRLATGDLKDIELRIVPGSVQGHASTKRQRIIIPSDEVIAVVAAALAASGGA